jgi:ATP-dependent DNA helicase RecG
MKVEEFLRLGESKTVEFKENASSNAKILSTAIAFSNTSGGHIIVGVEDKTHHVLGVSNPHELAESLASMIHDAVEPRIIPNIEIIPFRKTYLVVIEVFPSASRPHYERSRGKERSTYIRIGSTTRLADQELLKLIEHSVLTRSFDEEECPRATLEDIDLDYARKLFEPKHKIDINQLVSLGALVKDREIYGDPQKSDH